MKSSKLTALFACISIIALGGSSMGQPNAVRDVADAQKPNRRYPQDYPTMKSLRRVKRTRINVADYFTPEQIARGKRYHHEKYAFYFTGLLVTLVLLSLLSFTNLSNLILNSVKIPKRRWLTAALFVLVVMILLRAARLPISVWSGYYHERAYGLLAPTRTLGMWLTDYLKGFAIDAALTLPVALGLLLVIGRYPRWWWTIAGVCASVLMVVLVNLAPIIIDPIFNKFKPVENEELRERAIALTEKAGIKVKDVLEMDASVRTKKVNAYFTGLGNTKRIVLYDNLIEGASIEEIESVLAHEIGHWRHNHIWKGIAFGAAGTFLLLFIIAQTLKFGAGTAAFKFSSPSDPAALPFIMLIVIVANFLASPIASGLSRSFERQADWASLVLTQNVESFVTSEKELAIRNLGDVDPHPFVEWFFYSHPSTKHRIEMALDYAEVERMEKGG